MSGVNDIADAELIRRVISGIAGRRPRTKNTRRAPLWRPVGDAFCLGSSYAAQLCRRFGFDPDLEVRA